MTASLFLQSWTHDLELASCLLPAATGSWVSKRLVQFFPFPLGSFFILVIVVTMVGLKKIGFRLVLSVGLAVGVELLMSERSTVRN